MGARHLELSFEGENHETVAKEFVDLFEILFGTHLTLAPNTYGSSNAPPGTKADPWTKAAVILAIPGAILATFEVAERLQTNQKVQQLIEWAQKKGMDQATTRIHIALPGGRVVKLESATSAEILRAAQPAEEKEKGSL